MQTFSFDLIEKFSAAILCNSLLVVIEKWDTEEEEYKRTIISKTWKDKAIENSNFGGHGIGVKKYRYDRKPIIVRNIIKVWLKYFCQ
jgi:hypothetical protein